MIKLAMEIPTSHLATWSPLTDFDFALAHKVLEDPAVARFYAERSGSRELILDNSMHELGYPLPVKELARAADLCRADYVIAPDQLKQPDQNLAWFEDTVNEIAGHHKVAVVHCGPTPGIRQKYFTRVAARADMLCLPFRENRMLWWAEIDRQQLDFPCLRRVHLLGVNDLAELYVFARLSMRDAEWSVDTSKPIKWAIEDRHIGDGFDIRGAKTTSHALLDAKLTTPQVALMIRNLEHLRAYLV